jgi:MGT family glycosyltransferase
VIHRLIDRVIAGPALAYAQDTLAAVDAFKPHAVVSQELLLGVMAAAESRALPLALFTANIWSLPTLAGVPPFGAGHAGSHVRRRARHARHGQPDEPGLLPGRPALAERRPGGAGPRAARGPVRAVEKVDKILLGTSRAFDFAPDPLQTPFAYVGPYLADPAWAEPFAPPAGDAPLIIVSFSSLYQAQEAPLARVIEALGRLPVRGVVTTGPTLAPEEFPAPDNVAVVRSAPHGALLGEAAVFVTHAGHGSTLRPLMAGVPLLCLPMGRDQNDNAARVTARGAGLRLGPDASVDAIAAAITDLLASPNYRSAAKALGEAIARDAETRSATALIEALV